MFPFVDWSARIGQELSPEARCFVLPLQVLRSARWLDIGSVKGEQLGQAVGLLAKRSRSG
jgi:hypothetical protein